MGRRSWRKILYEKQDYPDNYVDARQFLNGMKKNRELGSSLGLLPRPPQRESLGTKDSLTYDLMRSPLATF